MNEIERINKLVDENSNVLIIGGHIGSLAIPISKFVNNCTVIEASPKTYELLKTNILLNKCDNITRTMLQQAIKREIKISNELSKFWRKQTCTDQ